MTKIVKSLSTVFAVLLLAGNAAAATSVERSTLAKSLTVPMETSAGRQNSSAHFPVGTKCDILQRGDLSSLISVHGKTIWVDNRSLSGFGASLDSPAEQLPAPYRSRVVPNLFLQELVPFALTARISSLATYTPPPAVPNRCHSEAASAADFTLVWGPLMYEPSLKSTQTHRRNNYRFTLSASANFVPAHFCHNFHIVHDSLEIRDKILSCKPGDIVHARGSFVSILSPPEWGGKALWTSSLTTAFCYLFLVKEIEVVGRWPK